MSEAGPTRFEGDLPDGAIRVLSYEVGYGTMSMINEDGGVLLPVVTMKPNDGPLQFFVAPDAMRLGQHLDEAAVEAMRTFAPELRKLPTPKEIDAQRRKIEVDANRRKRVTALVWLAVVGVIAIIAAAAGLSIWGAIQGTLWVLGLIWLTEVAAIWFVERQEKRRSR